MNDDHEPESIRDAPPLSTPYPAFGPVVLRTEGLIRDLGAGEVMTRILYGIDMEVRRGEFVALTGLSGSGKSTLLYLLGALDRPTEGRVLLEGIDVSELDDDERAELRGEKLGFVFQFHFLLPEFSVLENVMLPMLRRGKYSEDQCEDKARDVLELIGLGPLADRRPNQLSGGQQQRVSIARAVANEPSIILADEPTGNLDSKNGIIVMELFEKLVREQAMTVIMVTHERSFAARASRRIDMRDGRILTDELLIHDGTHRVKSLKLSG